MSRFVPRIARPWVAHEVFDSTLRNPQRIFRQMEREMNALERHFDRQMRDITGENDSWTSNFIEPNRFYRNWIEETPEERFYNSKQYSELVDKYSKEIQDLKSNYVKQLESVREVYQKQAQEMYDKHVAEIEKEQPKNEEGSNDQGRDASRYESHVRQRSIQNGRVRESVERHVKNVNGKSVEQVVTTKYLEDGSREVHEVTKDENGTREKTTRYDAQNKLEGNKAEELPESKTKSGEQSAKLTQQSGL